MTRLNTEVDKAKHVALRHRLLDDGLSFTKWLHRQIDAYLAEDRPRAAVPKPPARSRREKEA